MIGFYTPAGDPVTTLTFQALAAGVDSDVLELEAWHDRGNPGGADREPVVLLIQTEDPAAAGVYRSAGLPPQDELWARIRVVGVDNTAEPAWTLPVTEWLPWGAFAGLLLTRIPPDCGVKLEVKMHPPPWAASLPYRFHVVPFYEEFSRPLPPVLAAAAGAGILTHNGDRSRSYLLRGLEVTPSAPADDVVHSSPGLWLYRGRVFGSVTVDTTLNQNDGAAAALAAGESYIAVLSRSDAGLTVTKGLKGIVPQEPAAPAYEPVEAVVTVSFEAGGTSVIDAGEISGPRNRGRFLIRELNALDLEVAGGEAVYGATYRFRDRAKTLTATDDATESVFLTAAGDVVVGPSPPDDAALELAEVEAAAGAIVAIRDRRTYLGVATYIELRISAGVADARHVEGRPLDVERVTVRLSDNGGGISGQTVVDVLVDGISIWDTAVEDLRPTFAFDAVDLVDDATFHQLAAIPAGALVEAVFAEEPTLGSPATAWVTLHCREPR